MAGNFFKRFTDLSHTTDIDGTIGRISSGVSLKGFNIWILVCASILACIGLDTNSVAVIIGAMLISPLMSPILGVGLSLGIHDRELFLRSLKNLLVAVALSLLSSTLYFLVSPFGDVTEELLSRTHPTLLDVGVAFVGGVAGIVSMSRKETTNAIPGVAIATALMPPLCTSGFGLASGNWEFFLGAFYLFFINALFISLSTYLIVKYLKFPIKEYIDKRKQASYTRISWVLLVLSLIPSIYFLYTVYNNSKAKLRIQSLVIKNIERHGNEILKWGIDASDSVKYVNVYYSGDVVSEQQIDSLQALCKQNGLADFKIKVLRVNVTKEEITGLSTNVARQMLNDWQIKMMTERQEDSASWHIWVNEAKVASKEAKVAFPVFDSINIARSILIDDATHPDTLVTVWYKPSGKMHADDMSNLTAFIKLRMHTDTLLLNKL
ncbi:MAG: TIGR00341 family protein [Sphingobacteriales bacterium]|nr:MAG: TIGR00341 family protein [Sphingobacteriales bacterium]